MGMETLAKHIITTAQRENLGITNLQLQKVMYFTLVYGLKQEVLTVEEVKELYDNKFLVWRYGPVVENIYETYRVFGASNIFYPEDTVEYPELDEIIIKLLKKNPFDLVKKSHRHKKWCENKESIQYGRGNVEYDVEDLVDAARE